MKLKQTKQTTEDTATIQHDPTTTITVFIAYQIGLQRLQKRQLPLFMKNDNDQIIFFKLKRA